MAAVPPNNPSSPRWLLDIEAWEIRDYRDIEIEVLESGYGIISYTWGRWANWDRTPDDLPRGLQWQVPYVDQLPLQLARDVIGSLQSRFIWWDWMCVPQGSSKTLPPELLQAKGEEVGKQMAIYKGANKSLVWLHQTNWDDDTPLRRLLKNETPKESLESYLRAITDALESIKEPWLTSGWTLQEGVLLTETVLLDHNGQALEGDHFFHNNGRASVVDLTSGITLLATRIGAAFMQVSDADPEDQYLDEFARWVRGDTPGAANCLSRLVRSGLVAYTKDSPLYILAGKSTRNFSVEVDAYWALLGALEITTIVPWYNDVHMDRVREVFFAHLLRKHQWPLMLIPHLTTESKQMRTLKWSEKFADGFYLPLGVFFDVYWKQNLPHLSWGPAEMKGDLDTIHMTAEKGLPFNLLRLTTARSGFWRRFEQPEVDPQGGAVIVTPVTRINETRNLFLPIADLSGRLGVPGVRCIEIEPANPESPQAKRHPGRVGQLKGVTDLWAKPNAVEEVHFTKYSLHTWLD